MINGSDYRSEFHAALIRPAAMTARGKVVDGTSATMTAASTLDGSDVNKKETDGIFTALIRLKQALENNDTAGIQRAVGLLDNATQQLNFSHAELGARQQGFRKR